MEGHTFSRVNETEIIEWKTVKWTLKISKDDEEGDMTDEEI